MVCDRVSEKRGEGGTYILVFDNYGQDLMWRLSNRDLVALIKGHDPRSSPEISAKPITVGGEVACK